MENLYRSFQDDKKKYHEVPVTPSASLQSSISIWMNADVQKHMTRLPKYAGTFLVRPPNNAGVENHFRSGTSHSFFVSRTLVVKV
jgi:hypothetical protein